ncbi:hypothetical protein CYMTET_54502 [Cymbomonas tetramitiformis]|uniref:Cyclic nucleotide-binding domain-containing protein n=1 Tax=Cymbomonas tetramitiformis TaxID=36881 RepID=A0AAE0ENN1_9CHLO|nr:hypothetical protein CYMTET_54502 [Cymbomonas tetramitiformis]
MLTGSREPVLNFEVFTKMIEGCLPPETSYQLKKGVKVTTMHMGSHFGEDSIQTGMQSNGLQIVAFSPEPSVFLTLSRYAFQTVVELGYRGFLNTNIGMLKRTALFSTLTESHLTTLACGDRERYSKGSHLFREGDVASSVYIVCAGEALLWTSSQPPEDPSADSKVNVEQKWKEAAKVTNSAGSGQIGSLCEATMHLLRRTSRLTQAPKSRATRSEIAVISAGGYCGVSSLRRPEKGPLPRHSHTAEVMSEYCQVIRLEYEDIVMDMTKRQRLALQAEIKAPQEEHYQERRSRLAQAVIALPSQEEETRIHRQDELDAASAELAAQVEKARAFEGIPQRKVAAPRRAMGELPSPEDTIVKHVNTNPSRASASRPHSPHATSSPGGKGHASTAPAIVQDPVQIGKMQAQGCQISGTMDIKTIMAHLDLPGVEDVKRWLGSYRHQLGLPQAGGASPQDGQSLDDGSAPSTPPSKQFGERAATARAPYRGLMPSKLSTSVKTYRSPTSPSSPSSMGSPSSPCSPTWSVAGWAPPKSAPPSQAPTPADRSIAVAAANSVYSSSSVFGQMPGLIRTWRSPNAARPTSSATPHNMFAAPQRSLSMAHLEEYKL